MQELNELKKIIKRVKEIKGIIRRLIALQLYDVQKCYGQYVKIQSQVSDCDTCRLKVINTSTKEVLLTVLIYLSDSNENIIKIAFNKLFKGVTNESKDNPLQQ